MVGSDVEGTGFMYFVERVDSYVRAQNTPGLLIGDRESESISGTFAESLSGYRAAGTAYRFGKKLTHLVDTVHFTNSHHSRMLQLADMHVWLRQLCSTGDNVQWHRKQIIEHVRSINDCLHANRCRRPIRGPKWRPPRKRLRTVWGFMNQRVREARRISRK